MRRQIELLSEYHTRLISDVMTGKLDVREAAKKLRDPQNEGSDGDRDCGLESTGTPEVNELVATRAEFVA